MASKILEPFSLFELAVDKVLPGSMVADRALRQMEPGHSMWAEKWYLVLLVAFVVAEHTVGIVVRL